MRAAWTEAVQVRARTMAPASVALRKFFAGRTFINGNPLTCGNRLVRSTKPFPGRVHGRNQHKQTRPNPGPGLGPPKGRPEGAARRGPSGSVGRFTACGRWRCGGAYVSHVTADVG